MGVIRRRAVLSALLASCGLWWVQPPSPLAVSSAYAKKKVHPRSTPPLAPLQVSAEPVFVVPALASDFGDPPTAPRRARVAVLHDGRAWGVTERGLERLREPVAPHPEGVPVLVFAGEHTGAGLETLNSYLLDAGPLLYALSSDPPPGELAAERRLAEPRSPNARALVVRGGERAIPLRRSFSALRGLHATHPSGTCRIPIQSCTDRESIAEVARRSDGCGAIAFVQGGGRSYRWTGEDEAPSLFGGDPGWVEVGRPTPTLHLPVIDLH